MTMTIRPVSTIEFIGLSETNTIGYYTSQEVFMSACTVWELVLTLAVVVLAGFAFHYRNLASRMKTRARIYIQYVPRDQLTGEERVVLEDFKKDLGLT